MLCYVIVKILLSMLFVMSFKAALEATKNWRNPQYGLNEDKKQHQKENEGTTGYCLTALRFRPYFQWPIQGRGLPPPPFLETGTLPHISRSGWLPPPLPLIWRCGSVTLPCRSLIKYPAILLAAQGPISDKISWHSVSADKANDWASHDGPSPWTS